MSNKDLDPLNLLAITFLERLGVGEPSEQLINIMENTLSHVSTTQSVLFNERLNKKECACLFLAAKGKTTEETADLMKMRAGAVESCRRNIKRKLNATSMAQAVFEGMRFGYLVQNSNLTMKF